MNIVTVKVLEVSLPLACDSDMSMRLVSQAHETVNIKQLINQPHASRRFLKTPSCFNPNALAFSSRCQGVFRFSAHVADVQKFYTS